MCSVTSHHDAPKEYGNIRNSIEYFLKFNVEKDRKILDIGTNLGSFPHELHMLGYTAVHGIDISEDAIRHGRQRYAAIRDNLSSYEGNVIPFPSGSFDVVTMFDVIEHIPKIGEFLLEANRVLARGGRLVFQTPNIYVNSVWSTIVFRSLAWREAHCSLQSLRSLRRLLSQAGFHQVVIEKVSIDTDFNRTQVSRQLGSFGLRLLQLSSSLPLALYPNFYGSAVK